MKRFFSLLLILAFALSGCVGATAIDQETPAVDLTSEEKPAVETMTDFPIDPIEIIGGDERSLREFLSSWFDLSYPKRREDESLNKAVYVDSIPDDLPYGLPVPDDVNIIGSMTGVWAEYVLVFKTELSEESVHEYYRKILLEQGWLDENMEMLLGGFVEGPSQYGMYCYGDEAALGINALRFPDGQTTVQLNLDIEPEYNCNSVGNGYGFGFESLIPQLVTPAGASLQRGGAGSSDRDAEVTAYLKTALSPIELIEFYNQQLEAAGWEMKNNTFAQADDGEGGAAWSLWALEDDDGNSWQGSLMVLKASEDAEAFAVLRIEKSR